MQVTKRFLDHHGNAVDSVLSKMSLKHILQADEETCWVGPISGVRVGYVKSAVGTDVWCMGAARVVYVRFVGAKWWYVSCFRRARCGDVSLVGDVSPCLDTQLRVLMRYTLLNHLERASQEPSRQL